MTAQPIFDGTFSCEAVAAAAHALVTRLHDEAMASIAELAENWDRPAQDAPAVEDEPVVYREPATWSVVDEDDVHGPAEDDEDDDVRVVPLLDLPALLPRPRTANVTSPVETPSAGNVAGLLATAATDEFAVPAQDDRQSVGV